MLIWSYICSSEHWQNKPVSAIHGAKNRNSNTNTYRITCKHQESEFNFDTSKTLGA